MKYDPAYLKALRAPLDNIQFVPTGGVSAENAAAFRRADPFTLGGSSAVVKGQMEEIPVIQDRARRLREAWDSAL